MSFKLAASACERHISISHCITFTWSLCGINFYMEPVVTFCDILILCFNPRYCDCAADRLHSDNSFLNSHVCHWQTPMECQIPSEVCQVLYHWCDCACRGCPWRPPTGCHVGLGIFCPGKIHYALPLSVCLRSFLMFGWWFITCFYQLIISLIAYFYRIKWLFRSLHVCIKYGTGNCSFITYFITKQSSVACFSGLRSLSGDLKRWLCSAVQELDSLFFVIFLGFNFRHRGERQHIDNLKLAFGLHSYWILSVKKLSSCL